MAQYDIQLPLNLDSYLQYYNENSSKLLAMSNKDAIEKIRMELKNQKDQLEEVATQALSVFNVDGSSIEEKEKNLTIKIQTLQKFTQGLNGKDYQAALGARLNKAEVWEAGKETIQNQYEELLVFLKQQIQNDAADISDSKLAAALYNLVAKNMATQLKLTKKTKTGNIYYRIGSSTGQAIKISDYFADLTKETQERLRKFMQGDVSLNNNQKAIYNKFIQWKMTNSIQNNKLTMNLSATTVFDFLKLKESEAKLLFQPDSKELRLIWETFFDIVAEQCNFPDITYLSIFKQCFNEVENENPYKIFVGKTSLLGILGEIQSLFYTRCLLKADAIGSWKGGTYQNSLQPHADLLIQSFKGQFGVQVKNVSLQSAKNDLNKAGYIDFESFSTYNYGDKNMFSGTSFGLTEDAEKALDELNFDPDTFKVISSLLAMRIFNVPYNYDLQKSKFIQTSLDNLYTGARDGRAELFKETYNKLHNDNITIAINAIMSQFAMGMMYMQSGLWDNVNASKANSLYIIGGIQVYTAYTLLKKIYDNFDTELQNFTFSARREGYATVAEKAQGMDGTIVDVLNTHRFKGKFSFTSSYNFKGI